MHQVFLHDILELGNYVSVDFKEWSLNVVILLMILL